MGLIDFVKDAGASVFGGGEPDSAEVEGYLRGEFGDRAPSLKAAFQEGTLKIVAVCDTVDTREQLLLVAGNIKGVERVDDEYLRVATPDEVIPGMRGQSPAAAPPAQAPPAPTQTAPAEGASEFYTIKPGDTLGKIAKEHYGDAMKYKMIFEANETVIKNPDMIYPGQKIRLPKI
ncbi:LysM peptidoglycan-binding domain-containing protein [candidate division CSSED10-310 bacterium]|uniref:LysM peptidoglycan-binding domain-containing protein n=1 Tax=candidate division CSSED10-310 bacterium TaxID=2855610 RepID=A0ABV6YX58_UNCC1